MSCYVGSLHLLFLLTRVVDKSSWILSLTTLVDKSNHILSQCTRVRGVLVFGVFDGG